MMTKRIIMLVGVPAVGKSTWIQKEYQGECFVASTDNIIEVLAAEFGKTYDEIFSTHIKAAEKMFWEDFDEFVQGGYSPIVIDRTNLSVKSRAKFFNRLKQWHKNHKYTLAAVVFDTPDIVEHERRLASRPGKTIPEHVVKSMLSSFEYPAYEEGFNVISKSDDL